MTDTPAARLAALGITLPVAAAPAANYVPAVAVDAMLHISGQIPFAEDGSLVRSVAQVKPGDAVSARLADGEVKLRVE